ncbi:MAG: ABC transporter permease [Chitinophagaceae bacterium]|nr:ABC transporter permease [Chitinophagaceae bacterium]
MFKNYLNLAARNVLKWKRYSVLNILGLAIGMACCLLIFQYVAYEKGYDDFLKSDQVVRLRLDTYRDGKLDWQSAAVYPAFGPTMKKDFPEVEAYCRLAPAELLLSNDERNTKFNEPKGYYADPSFLSMFDIKIVKGNVATMLQGLDKIVLSADMARKYFGDEQPVGKTLVYRAPFFTRVFQVTGIFDPPVHSHLSINYLISYPTIGSARREFGDMTRPEETSWGWYQFYTYLLLKKGTDIKKLEAELPAFCDRYINNLAWKKESNTRNEVSLIPVKDIHLHSHYMQEAEAGGNERSVLFLFLLAFFIVAIAWVNYVNLSTSRSLERAKEVGVRKVVGATRIKLIMQFLVESVLINIVSFILALVIAYLAAPWFSDLVNDMPRTQFYLPVSYCVLIGVIFATGTLLSGFYPAFILSGFRPTAVLKGTFKNSTGGLALRKTLIVVQFAASVVLIAGTIIVYSQLSYMRSQPLGVNIQQTLVLEGAGSVRDSAYRNVFQPFKEAVKLLPGIKNITASTSVMGKENTWSNAVARSNASNASAVNIDFLGADYDFIPTYEMKIIAGRNFSGDFPSDSNAAILNETAVRMLGFESPEQAIDQKIRRGGERTVIGVVKDYHTEYLNKMIEPQLIILRLNARDFYSVKMDAANISSVTEAVRAKWNTCFPNDPFSYYFLDEAFDRQYKADRQFGRAFGIFSGISIFIACMGLLGLSAYNVLQRAKEIGIRKVLGASVRQIVYMLSKDFLKLVVIASVIAVPVAWWAMNKWLQSFAYRIDIGWWVFVVAGVLALLIALMTLGLQAIKAAMANPAKSLRTE